MDLNPHTQGASSPRKTATGELGPGARMGRRNIHGSVTLMQSGRRSLLLELRQALFSPQRMDGKNHFMKPNAM